MKKKHNTLKMIQFIIAVLLLLPFVLSIFMPVPIPFSDKQPETEYLIMEKQVSNKNIANIIKRANDFWMPTDEYWPIPSFIVERDSFWWVKFKKKCPTVLRCGIPIKAKEKPGGVTIKVNKPDMQCSFASAR